MPLSRQNATIWENTDGVSSFTSSNFNSQSSTTNFLHVNVTNVRASDNDDDDDEVRTCDEGSPASQISLTSDDFCVTVDDQHNSPCAALNLNVATTTMPPPFVIPEGFSEMVIKQQQERVHENTAKKAAWVTAMASEVHSLLPGELRLPTLIAESHRHEVLTIRRNQKHLTEAQAQDLLADTKRSYTSIFAEVQRAVKSTPPPNPEMTVDQHRQNVAQSGVQCFAAMLPYSNGVCGAITDACRAQYSALTGIPQHVLLDNGFHTLHGSPVMMQPTAPSATVSVASAGTSASGTLAFKCPKGTTVGRTGRFIPISMSAEHGKGDRVSHVRRKTLAAAKKNNALSNSLPQTQTQTQQQQQQQQQHNYRTPQFARQQMPTHAGAKPSQQYRRRSGGGCGAPNVREPYHQTQYVDPMSSH